MCMFVLLCMCVHDVQTQSRNTQTHMTHIPPALLTHRGQCVDVGSCVFVVVKSHCGYVRAYELVFIYE